nr:hypothetical protein Iba_chr03dCG12030 [Ipomoea batatas]
MHRSLSIRRTNVGPQESTVAKIIERRKSYNVNAENRRGPSEPFGKWLDLGSIDTGLARFRKEDWPTCQRCECSRKLSKGIEEGVRAILLEDGVLAWLMTNSNNASADQLGASN